MTTSLITGCSTGIGLATAVHLAAHGHTVYASIRDEASGDALLAAAAEAGAEVAVLSLDVNDPESIRDGVDHVLATAGGLDVLVNNAGVGDLSTVEETTDAGLRQMFQTHSNDPSSPADNAFCRVRDHSQCELSLCSDRFGSLRSICSNQIRDGGHYAGCSRRRSGIRNSVLCNRAWIYPNANALKGTVDLASSWWTLRHRYQFHPIPIRGWSGRRR